MPNWLPLAVEALVNRKKYVISTSYPISIIILHWLFTFFYEINMYEGEKPFCMLPCKGHMN